MRLDMFVLMLVPTRSDNSNNARKKPPRQSAAFLPSQRAPLKLESVSSLKNPPRRPPLFQSASSFERPACNSSLHARDKSTEKKSNRKPALLTRDESSGTKPNPNRKPALLSRDESTGTKLLTEDVLYFERNGHLLTRGFFTKEEVDNFRPPLMEAFLKRELESLRQKVRVIAGDKAYRSATTVAQCRKILDALPNDMIPFLQVFNLWRSSDAAREIALSRRMASTAATLLGTHSVRLYQDSMFIKRPGDGPTLWHSDLNMAPIDTNDFVTAWVPLHPIPEVRQGGCPLVFANRSHRDFALAYWWNGGEALGDLRGRYVEHCHGSMEVGDVTWHHGWTLHGSPANGAKKARVAVAFSYFADGCRVLGKRARRRPDDEDDESYRDWLAQLKPGSLARHALLPLVPTERNQDTP